MAFHPIDLNSFPRREHYLSFIGNNQCSYSMTVNVDITALGAHKLYPAMIWLLTRTVNEIPEFRMALVDGVLGVYDDMHPAYCNHAQLMSKRAYTSKHPGKARII